MRSPIKFLVGAAAAGLALAAARAADGFDRYRVILEREPFGAPPPEPEAPPAPPAEEEPPWAKTYRLCSVYQSNNSEVQVALLDTKTNKPVMLTLGKGPVEGIELVSADLSAEEAVLRKDGRQATMKLEASKTPPPRPAAASGRTPTPARAAAGQAAGRAPQPAQGSTPARRGVIRAVPR